MDLVSCDKCGKEYPKSKLKKCQTCGQILCFKCRLFHKCQPKDKETVLSESDTIKSNPASVQSKNSQPDNPITFNLKQGLYAQRYNFENLQELFKRGFKISAGLKVFFVQNGNLQVTLRPGSYNSLSSVNNSLGINKLTSDDYTSIIIVDTTFISLPFEISETKIKTKDGTGVSVTGTLSLLINDGVMFCSHYLNDIAETTEEILAADILSIIEKCSKDTLIQYDASEFEKYSYLDSIARDSLKDYLNNCLNIYGLNIIKFSAEFKFSLPTISPHDFEIELSEFKAEAKLEASVVAIDTISTNAERREGGHEDGKYKKTLAAEHARKSYLERERFYFERSYPSGNFQAELEKMVLSDPLNLPVRPALLSLIDSDNGDVKRAVGDALIQRAIIIDPADILLISQKYPLLAGNILVAKSEFETLSQMKEFSDSDTLAFESLMREQYAMFSDEIIGVLTAAFQEL